MDDGKSFEFKNGHSVSSTFNFSNGELSGTASSHTSKQDLENLSSRVERVILIGLNKKPKAIRVDSKELHFNTFTIANGQFKVVVKDPKVIVGSLWKINFEF